MSYSPRDILEFRNGAQELDLPDEAQQVFDDLKEAVRTTSPALERKGEKIMYRYDVRSECTKFSEKVFRNKAQDILKILSSVDLKPGPGIPSVPAIYGFDKCGALTSEGYVSVAVLIQDFAEIEIDSDTETIPHHWESGRILLLKTGTILKRNYKKGNHVESMETEKRDKRDMEMSSPAESGEERLIVFYAMLPVQEDKT